MSYWDETIRFKDLEVPRFMAAPLDGITDAPTRQLIRKFSPTELLFTEMRHVACVFNELRQQSLQFKEMERPLGFQFSANHLKFIEGAVEKVLEKGVDMINLNLGCPAKNVIKSGSGSALMADLPRLKEVLTEFMRCIDGRVSFTVKIRAGYKKEKNAVEVAQLIEGLGIDGLMIHPRLQTEGFTGLPDLDLVREVKEAVKIPVIMSGNINSFKRAQKVYDRTGVDGFMIGRALWGCPWKIREITDAAKGVTFEVSPEETLEYALEHLRLTVEHYGPTAFHAFKKQLPVYIKGVENAGQIRKKLLSSQTAEELEAGIRALLA